YQQARRELLRHFGAITDPYVAERTARACLLMPAEGSDLQAAATLAERAVSAKENTDQWIFPYFLFAHGLPEFREGPFESAISIMSSRAAEVMGPCPRLVIAMSMFELGQRDEARRALAIELNRYDWSERRALGRDDWIWHILRREAEAKILPVTSAFLQ